jgi:transposase
MTVSPQGSDTLRGDKRGARRRRRLWSDDEKRRIVAETLEPGASVSGVARRHDANANMVFAWRREFGAVLAATTDSATTFVPAVIASAAVTAPVTVAKPAPNAGRMEIRLTGGARVIVGDDVDAAALARVVNVLVRR